MAKERIHRFEYEGKRYAIDPETCFCFECDDVSWDVLAYYPAESVTRILHELQHIHDARQIKEVISELEWLRATKSILPHVPPDKFIKQFDVEKGLRLMSVRLPRHAAGEPAPSRSWFAKRRSVAQDDPTIEFGLAALELLLGRSLEQKELSVLFLYDRTVDQCPELARLCAKTFQIAALSGKTINVAVEIASPSLTDLPAPLSGHALSVAFTLLPEVDVLEVLRPFEKTFSLDQVLRTFKGGQVRGKVLVQPNHPSYSDVVPELVRLGFDHIEVDLDGAFSRNPSLRPAEMLESMRATARFYAECLQSGKYFRLEPVAGLFYRIYEGKPQSRTDPAGLHELSIDENGRVYPGKLFLGNQAHAVGSLSEGKVDEERLLPFHNVGSLTTGACRRCWARNLCGGGNAAVHAAFTGSYRVPHAPWCEMQRDAMASTIASFNLLTSAGVNFTRIYTPIATQKRSLSLLTMVRAAMHLTVSMRPIEENDAALLAKWENWSEASYFVCHPGGLLLATVYEREMDALHPQTLEQEMILSRRNGQPIGLFRIAPDKLPGIANAAVFLKNPNDYRAPELQRGCRLLLEEAGKQQTLRRILTHAGDHESPLHEFLRALGFERVGTQREALFLHGRYHDVGVYALTLS